jgi:Flp pilus assembly protein TadG
MTSHRYSRPSLRSESGQSAVEFALVLPLLLVVLVGMVDFGFAFNYWIQGTHLASSGARYAAVNRAPGGGTLQSYVRSQAITSLRDGGTARTPDPLQVCVSFPDGTKTIGDRVQVEVKTNYRFTTILNVASATIGAKATMRLEAIPDPAVVPEGCA